MKILVTHSSNFDYKNELYVPLRSSSLNSDHSFILPHETGQAIPTRPFLEKKEVDLLIAEVSYPSTGQGIELGWADIFKIPVICIYKKGQIYSGSLYLVSKQFIEYESSEDLIKKITEYLHK